MAGVSRSASISIFAAMCFHHVSLHGCNPCSFVTALSNPKHLVSELPLISLSDATPHGV
jgi:hypothetical protein